MLGVTVADPLSGQQSPEWQSDMSPSPPIVSFDGQYVIEWVAINDDVMGGMSTGELVRTDAGTALFIGELSLENNGGFASVRALVAEPGLSSAHGLAIRVRGDGRRYQLRLRLDTRFDGIAYTATFDTEPGSWVTHRISFEEFRPTYRGRTPRDAAPLDPSRIRQLGLLIGDKRAGSFTVEIDWIRPWRDGDGT
jgi:monofunctional biosynthetic peptidoglycan transglycosylase